MSIKRTLLALALVAFAAACGDKPSAGDPAPAPAPAQAAAKGPGLWRIGDADTTIYLFGTVHVLPPDLNWRTTAVDKALGNAKAVYFETDINPDPAKVIQFIREYGQYTTSDRLSDHLSPKQHEEVAAAASKLNFPMVGLETQKPWMVANTLSELVITKAGYDVDSGVERKLEPIARVGGKEIRKLETVEEQLMVFADLPERVQINYLMAGVREMDKETSMLGDMVKAWAHGDTKTLDKVMIQDDLEETPEVYQALLVNRNANWVKKLDTLVKTEPGTFFVAVGAAHLTGKDSVLEKLKPLGYTVQRIE